MHQLAALVVMMLAPIGYGQTFYQPVEYEFQSGGTLYFYGGENPQVHAAAAELQASGAAWGRQSGFAFSASSVSVAREVETQRIRVFSDHWRHGLEDATLNHFNIADARNEAYSSAARYFRKRDLASQGMVTDSFIVISPRARSLTVRKSTGVRIMPQEIQPLLIVPKTLPPANPTISRASID